MIKLACLASFPLLAAIFCAHQAPPIEPPVAPATAAQTDSAAVEENHRIAEADREFLSRLEAENPAPPMVLRALPVARPSLPPVAKTSPRSTVTVSYSPVTAERALPDSRPPATTVLERPQPRQSSGQSRARIVIRGDSVSVIPALTAR